MMISRTDRRKLCVRDERIYRRLLTFYPKRFRKEFGERMTQLFRDQWKDASEKDAAAGRTRFWLRVLADIARTACREHFAELKDVMKESLIKSFLRWLSLTFTKLFAATFLLFAGVLVPRVVFVEPRIYSSTARLTVERQGASMTGTDHFLIQTEIERLKSSIVLNQVIRELGIGKKLQLQKGGSVLSSGEVFETLRDMVAIRQTHNTSSLEVRVFSEDRNLAAVIANKIVEVYQRQTEVAKAPRIIEVIDPAEPGPRPVRPNVPLSLFVITVSGIVFAGVIAFLIRRIVSRPAVQITKA